MVKKATTNYLTKKIDDIGLTVQVSSVQKKGYSYNNYCSLLWNKMADTFNVTYTKSNFSRTFLNMILPSENFSTLHRGGHLVKGARPQELPGYNLASIKISFGDRTVRLCDSVNIIFKLSRGSCLETSRLLFSSYDIPKLGCVYSVINVEQLIQTTLFCIQAIIIYLRLCC